MKQREVASRVSRLLERLGEGGPGVRDRPLESLSAPFAAALFLLRLADRDCLPRSQRWSSWCDLRGERLVECLREEVLPTLHDGPRRSLGFFPQPPALATVVEDLLRESPAVVEALVRWVRNFDLGNIPGRQAAGDALAALVEEATGKDTTAGDFTTPQPVVEMMVDLLDPGPGDSIYDPCFGNGGLLTTAARRLQQPSVFGVEIAPHAYCVGLARVLLTGIEEPRLELANALHPPSENEHSPQQFDCILAVPPWGGHVRPGIAKGFPVPTANYEMLFLQHVMVSLRRRGRAVVALPDAALFQTGTDQEVRKKLLTEFHVEGVVSLPPGAFHPIRLP